MEMGTKKEESRRRPGLVRNGRPLGTAGVRGPLLVFSSDTELLPYRLGGRGGGGVPAGLHKWISFHSFSARTPRPVISHACPLCKEVHVLTSAGMAGGQLAALRHRTRVASGPLRVGVLRLLGPWARGGSRTGPCAEPAGWGPGSCGVLASRWAGTFCPQFLATL